MRFRSTLVLFLMLPWAAGAKLPLPSSMIDLASPPGQQIFLQAEDRAAYWPLSAAFETQENQAFCGIASLVMVLNSLNVPAPVPTGYTPYHFFTQDDLFPPNGATFLQADWIEHHGLTLDQLGAIGRHFGLATRITHATPGGLAAFRTQAAQALATPGQYVIVNYKRAALQEEGYGHISPLAAYDAKTDRFLLLDVARYKYPPAWVPAAALYAAMNTQDPSSSATRGYLILSAPPR